MVTFLRAGAAVIGGLVLATITSMYAGLFFISYLVDNAVNWSPDRLNLKLGAFSVLLMVIIAMMVAIGVGLWHESKGWFVVTIFFSIWVSGDVAEGLAGLVHQMTRGLGWSQGEITTYVAFLVAITAGVTCGLMVELLYDTKSLTKRRKRAQLVIHTLRLDLGAISQRSERGSHTFLSGKWITWRVAEGLTFGSLASVAFLWHTQLSSPQTIMRIIWTCMVISAIGGVVLGLIFAFAHFQADGMLPRLSVETTAMLLIATYNTNWFWLILALAAIGTAVSAFWIIRSKRLLR